MVVKKNEEKSWRSKLPRSNCSNDLQWEQKQTNGEGNVKVYYQPSFAALLTCAPRLFTSPYPGFVLLFWSAYIHSSSKENKSDIYLWLFLLAVLAANFLFGSSSRSLIVCLVLIPSFFKKMLWLFIRVMFVRGRTVVWVFIFFVAKTLVLWSQS